MLSQIAGLTSSFALNTVHMAKFNTFISVCSLLYVFAPIGTLGSSKSKIASLAVQNNKSVFFSKIIFVFFTYIMSSNLENTFYDNHCFQMAGEHNKTPFQTIALCENENSLYDHIESVSLSTNSGKHLDENLPPIIMRKSICSASSVPLEQLENFLSDACSNADAFTETNLRRHSLSKLDAPKENYPRYCNEGKFIFH